MARSEMAFDAKSFPIVKFRSRCIAELSSVADPRNCRPDKPCRRARETATGTAQRIGLVLSPGPFFGVLVVHCCVVHELGT